MPVAALRPPPVAVGAGRRSARLQARFALRASSLEASAAVTVTVNGSAEAAVERKEKVQEDKDNEGLPVKEEQERGLEVLYDDGFGSVTVKDYFAAAKVLCRDDGGPPRWFSPVECGHPAVDQAPLLLFLPGMDGVGTGLILHHKSLGKVFEVRCLHIPVNDRTPFEGLVQIVENLIKHEHDLSPDRPIYLVGDSFGGSLALAVAARNPQIDLVLILVNPGSYIICKDSIAASIASTGISAKRVSCYSAVSSQFCHGNCLILYQGILFYGSSNFSRQEQPMQILVSMPCKPRFYFLPEHRSIMLPVFSGKDNLLPSGEEADRLFKALKNCRVRYFKDNGHTLLLEDGVNLLTVIKGANMYRRGRQRDSVTDYLPPTLSEFRQTFDVDHRLFHLALSPVMMSTLKDGKIVRGLAGVPDKGPVLFVGYHALMGIELSPLYEEFLREKRTVVRGMAHPFLFGKKFESSRQEMSRFDTVSMYGGLPVTPINMYRLFQRNQFVLLYPGGVREALHRKGEEYKLFWPDQPEFVRMAARFGVTIIPFGCVGEDDVLELVLDYNDQKNIPGLREWIQSINKEAERVRDSVKGEDGNQDMYLPALLPKVPGRFYYLFGQPIEMKGMGNLVRDRKSANEVYLRIKSQVEEIMSYLKRKREEDPYRSLPQRALYQATWGASAQVPTFEP
ncbi:Acyltransferase-like protein [Zea mays]|uniref:Acyltransferase-like protein n=1 Tax=Zea mays TaxID=4577 RepID=A0A3L6FKY1_MAIZE|nr:Acyltransferase-like protein [Zea mays]